MAVSLITFASNTGCSESIKVFYGFTTYQQWISTDISDFGML